MNLHPESRSGDAALDQWFTPFWAAEELAADALRGLGVVSVCEPSCGTGAFLAAVPPSCAAFGVEIDPRVVPAAVANSGREVLLGDFLTVDLDGRTIEVVMGNPPFAMATIERFIARSYRLLPEGGMVAMILPAFAFQTPSRVSGWMRRFSIDVNLIPRTLFPRISQALVWAKYIKTGERSFHGLMLFTEQRDVELMRPAVREALAGPGTWREVVRLALESLGGAASLAAIYDRVMPERRVSPHWQPKVRQILQLHFRSIERGRWAL